MSIYYYFSSKDAILEALVERNYEAPITTARHLAEQREISPFTRMALIFQACRNSSAAFLKTQPSTTKAAPERAFLHQKYMNHLIVSLKPVLASIIEQGIAQDLILCADPVSLAEIVLIVLTVKMDNTLVPSTADEEIRRFYCIVIGTFNHNGCDITDTFSKIRRRWIPKGHSCGKLSTA